jgi:long-subunit fatty acid transport protein
VASRGEDPGQDVDADITARDGGIFNLGLGVHLALSPRWELGAAYSSAIAIRSRGTARLVLGERLREPIAGGSGSYEVAPVADAVARCAPGGTSQALAACVDVTLPQAASIGLRHIAIDRRSRVRGDIELDLRWEDWSAAGDYRVVIDGQYLGIPIQESRVRHGTSDVFSLRLGGSYRLGNALRHELRAGIGYDGPAAPTSWARIDADSAAHLTASLGAALTLSRIQLALGVTVVDPPDISVAEPGATPTDSARTQPDVLVPTSAADRQPYHPFNSGRHTARYLIGSVGLSAHW